MAIQTYTDLVEQIAELSARDPSAIMPTLISLVESQCNRRLRVNHMIDIEDLSNGTTAGQFLYDWPSEALAIDNIEITGQNTRYPLSLGSPEALDQKFGLRSGIPQAYSLLGRKFEFRPCPDTAYRLTISYYARIIPLTVTEPQNWLIRFYPDVYLFGCLTYQALHVRDDDATKMWSDLFGNAINETQLADDANDWSGSTPAMVAL